MNILPKEMKQGDILKLNKTDDVPFNSLVVKEIKEKIIILMRPYMKNNELLLEEFPIGKHNNISYTLLRENNQEE